jgi:two-component system, LytTR family, sensor kinase
MNYLNAASLVNLLGFTVGVALYALLLAMVVYQRKASQRNAPQFLLLATAVLGLFWNIGELFTFIGRDFAGSEVEPFLAAVSYSALGFLPSVVVHSAQSKENKKNWLTVSAYFLSVFAAILHFHSAFFYNAAPSNPALQTLTAGAIALIFGLLIFNFRQTLEKKTIWASALLIFAVSALHLSGGNEEKSLLIELVAHQSSLPLALAILYQDYRFAFADLFLKRAVSLILLAFLAFGLYVFVAAPLLEFHETHDRNDVQAIGLILTLWMATALIYPSLHRVAVWLVDRVILRRADYAGLQIEIAEEIERAESQKAILDFVCRRLAEALTARNAGWTKTAQAESIGQITVFTPNRAEIIIPTAEAPFYKIHLENFFGGRRLLSDEIEILEKIALITARRIDAARVTDERFEQERRRQEWAKSATEAQLTALRAQINPHFLFNALTTIGYLIHSAPEKAFSTLMKLTGLLRGVLSSTGEFCALAAEIVSIENYLEIEKARFEERLEVEIDVPKELKNLRIPSLILQPLVENAVKHGVSKLKNGGKIEISANLKNNGDESFLILTVKDSGAGFDEKNFGENRIGLDNIKRRLYSYYGKNGNLTIKSEPGKGTLAEISFPVKAEIIYG